MPLTHQGGPPKQRLIANVDRQVEVPQGGRQASWVTLAAAAGPLPAAATAAAAAALSSGAGEGEGRGAGALVQPAAGVHGGQALQRLPGRLPHIGPPLRQRLCSDSGLGSSAQRVLLRALRAAAAAGRGGLQHQPLLPSRRALLRDKAAQQPLDPGRRLAAAAATAAAAAWRGRQQRRVSCDLVGRQRIRQRREVWAGPGLELHPPAAQRPLHHLPADHHAQSCLVYLCAGLGSLSQVRCRERQHRCAPFKEAEGHVPRAVLRLLLPRLRGGAPGQLLRAGLRVGLPHRLLPDVVGSPDVGWREYAQLAAGRGARLVDAIGGSS